MRFTSLTSLALALCPPQERPDVNYHTVAVDFIPPEVVQSSLTRIAVMLAKGAVVVIARRRYPAGITIDHLDMLDRLHGLRL